MKKLILLSVFTVACAITARALPTVAGDNFEIQWFYPRLDHRIRQRSFPRSSGTWTSVNDPNISITLSDGQIVVNVTQYPWSGGSGFNGFVFTDLSKVANFNSLALVSDPGYTRERPDPCLHCRHPLDKL